MAFSSTTSIFLAVFCLLHKASTVCAWDEWADGDALYDQGTHAQASPQNTNNFGYFDSSFAVTAEDKGRWEDSWDYGLEKDNENAGSEWLAGSSNEFVFGISSFCPPGGTCRTECERCDYQCLNGLLKVDGICVLSGSFWTKYASLR